MNHIGVYISNTLAVIKSVLEPFIYGFFIAFCLNPLVRFFENKSFSKIKFINKSQKLKRQLALIVTYVIFIGLIIWMISYLVPEIIGSISRMLLVLYGNMPQIQQTILHQLNFIPSDIIDGILQTVIFPIISTSTNITNILDTVIHSTVGIASGLLNLVLGVVISFYMIGNKEIFKKQIKKLLFVSFSKRISDKILAIATETNFYFEKFIVGKALDSTIIGLLCFILLTLIQTPYALILSIIVGVTNMIPYFGPFIGAIPAVFITLLSSPIQALWVAIIIFLLQQFDGMVLGPKILGDTIGLKPFWVIFSIIVGGSFLGVVGMFLGVPLFAALSAILTRFINKKYKTKIENQDKEILNE